MPISNIGISPTSTKGDILSSNGSSRSRIAVGTNGQILVARSSAASGIQHETISTSTPVFELIASSALTTSSASVIFSSIATTYKWLKIVGTTTSSSTGGSEPLIRINSNSSLTYIFSKRYRSGPTVTTQTTSSSGYYSVCSNSLGNVGDGVIFEVDISTPPNTSTPTHLYSRSWVVDDSGSTPRWTVGTARVSLNALVTSMTILNVSTDVFGAGSTFFIYGRKV